MAGRKGRSGGHNRLTPEEHILRGTFNPTRHGGRLARPSGPPAGPVPAGLVAGLTGPGRAFVAECWAHYGGWTPPACVLLRQAGRLLDDLAALQGQPGERAAQRLLLATLSALQLRDSQAAAPGEPVSKWAGALK
jgi:hypothetical protein